MICVSEFTVTPVAGLPPKVTAVAPVKSLPVIVTGVDPVDGPVAGLTLVMCGAAGRRAAATRTQ